ncbi:helix-turn-helix transcriptional regulator, partial [Nostoc sp.]
MNQQWFNTIFHNLTDRRKEVLLKLLANETDKVIAKSLNIVESTVRKHREEICKEFGLTNDFPDQRRS